MTNNHPITPPPELVQQWYTEADNQLGPYYDYIATQAARWGADQELEACCEWLVGDRLSVTASRLRAARRPQTPSLKEQALHALLHIDQGQHNERCHIIRRALEQLND